VMRPGGNRGRRRNVAGSADVLFFSISVEKCGASKKYREEFLSDALPIGKKEVLRRDREKQSKEGKVT